MSSAVCGTPFLAYGKAQLRTQHWLAQKEGFNPGKVESGHVTDILNM